MVAVCIADSAGVAAVTAKIIITTCCWHGGDVMVGRKEGETPNVKRTAAWHVKK